MGHVLITSEHIENLIDATIEDVKNGMGIRLYDLAGVFNSVAEAQDDPFLHVIPQAVGGFGSALMNSRAIVALPVLPDPMRQRLGNMVKNAVDEATESLKTIKAELCSEKEINHKELMHAVGELFRQAGILLKESRAISARRRGSSPSPVGEE
jgi:hypothetical protein